MSRSIHILYPYFTPAYKAGGPIQSLDSLVNRLGETLEFSILCSDRDLDGAQLKVQPDTWLPIQNSEVFYASTSFLKTGRIKNLICEREPSILFINGIYSWHFNMVPILNSKGIRKIVSVRGMLHPGALSQKSFKKKAYLGLWKMLGLHNKCEFHATSLQEKEYVEDVFGKHVKTWVAGNFPKVLEYQHPPYKAPGTLLLVSIALISPMKNHLLVLQALQKVTSVINYHIYGPVKDSHYWSQCEALVKTLPTNIKVLYKGEIMPHLVTDVLNNAHVFILPSKSENFGHAIYEAMTVGKPVITSNHTPWNHLQDKRAGMNVSIEHTDDLTHTIEHFAAMDNVTMNEWSKSTREYAMAAIDVEEIKEQYLEMFGVRTNDEV